VASEAAWRCAQLLPSPGRMSADQTLALHGDHLDGDYRRVDLHTLVDGDWKYVDDCCKCDLVDRPEG